MEWPPIELSGIKRGVGTRLSSPAEGQPTHSKPFTRSAVRIEKEREMSKCGDESCPCGEYDKQSVAEEIIEMFKYPREILKPTEPSESLRQPSAYKYVPTTTGTPNDISYDELRFRYEEAIRIGCQVGVEKLKLEADLAKANERWDELYRWLQTKETVSKGIHEVEVIEMMEKLKAD